MKFYCYKYFGSLIFTPRTCKLMGGRQLPLVSCQCIINTISAGSYVNVPLRITYVSRIMPHIACSSPTCIMHNVMQRHINCDTACCMCTSQLSSLPKIIIITTIVTTQNRAGAKYTALFRGSRPTSPGEKTSSKNPNPYILLTGTASGPERSSGETLRERTDTWGGVGGWGGVW